MALDFLTSLFQGTKDVIGKAGRGIGSFIEDNPDQFAILADSLGSNIAPDNPFAGIGKAAGQSNIAARANTANNKKQNSIIDLIIKSLGDKNTKTDSFNIKSDGEGGLNASLTFKGLGGLSSQIQGLDPDLDLSGIDKVRNQGIR